MVASRKIAQFLIDTSWVQITPCNFHTGKYIKVVILYLLLQIVKTNVKSKRDNFLFTKSYIPDFVDERTFDVNVPS